MANSGCSLGSTWANSSLFSVFEISNTFGSKKGRRYGSFISSSNDKRILPFFSRSENVGSTRTSPRKNVAFSSLGLEANVVGSRKLSVEMASEEKNGCVVSDDNEIRPLGRRVNSRGRRSAVSPAQQKALTFQLVACTVPFDTSRILVPRKCSFRVLSQALHGPAVRERWSSTHVHGVQHASESVQVIRRRELRVKGVLGR